MKNEKWEMGNAEMGRRHIVFYKLHADILSLQPSNVMRKSMFVNAFIMVCKLALYMHCTFDSLLAFLKLVEL